MRTAIWLLKRALRAVSEHGRDVQRRGIAAHGEVEIGGEKHSCFVLKGMNTLPGDFKGRQPKDLLRERDRSVQRAGTYMLTAQKKVFAKERRLSWSGMPTSSASGSPVRMTRT